MYHHRKHSGLSDYSRDYSTKQPPSLYNKVNKREEYNRKLHKLKRSIKELTTDFEKEQQNLSDKITEMMKSIDKLEFMHKATTVGNLAGSSMGVAGGITAIVGLALSPVTLGVSLLVTGAGAAAIAAGGTTRHACNLTNMMKLESLQETIHSIINDLLSTILPIMQQMRTISNILEEMKEMEQGMRVMQAGVRAANSGGVHAEERSRNRKVYVETVRSFKVCERAEQIFSVAAQADKVAPAVTAVTGIVSALFVVIDVVRIAQSYKEIATMNKKADKRKAKDIKSETLKYIHQKRETVALFQEILDEVNCFIDKVTEEFKEKQNVKRHIFYS